MRFLEKKQMFKSYEELKYWLEQRDFQKNINNFAKKYKNKKVILYGAGILAKVVLDNYDLSKLNIIAVADAKFTGDEEFYGFKASSPDKISELKPDLILINAYNPALIVEYLDKNFAELKKIPKFSIVKSTIKDKIKAIKEVLGIY
jgi:hypothetical protein